MTRRPLLPRLCPTRCEHHASKHKHTLGAKLQPKASRVRMDVLILMQVEDEPTSSSSQNNLKKQTKYWQQQDGQPGLTVASVAFCAPSALVNAEMAFSSVARTASAAETSFCKPHARVHAIISHTVHK